MAWTVRGIRGFQTAGRTETGTHQGAFRDGGLLCHLLVAAGGGQCGSVRKHAQVHRAPDCGGPALRLSSRGIHSLCRRQCCQNPWIQACGAHSSIAALLSLKKPSLASRQTRNAHVGDWIGSVLWLPLALVPALSMDMRRTLGEKWLRAMNPPSPLLYSTFCRPPPAAHQRPFLGSCHLGALTHQAQPL